MSEKLTRATVPMCPDCEVKAIPVATDDGEEWACPCCKVQYSEGIDFGYYPSGVVQDVVQDVVQELREAADALPEGDWTCRAIDLLDWADRLEGERQ